MTAPTDFMRQSSASSSSAAVGGRNVAHYFHALAGVPGVLSPFGLNAPSIASMEQLTKYYEHVAEAMRLTNAARDLHAANKSSSP